MSALPVSSSTSAVELSNLLASAQVSPVNTIISATDSGQSGSGTSKGQFSSLLDIIGSDAQAGGQGAAKSQSGQRTDNSSFADVADTSSGRMQLSVRGNRGGSDNVSANRNKFADQRVQPDNNAQAVRGDDSVQVASRQERLPEKQVKDAHDSGERDSAVLQNSEGDGGAVDGAAASGAGVSVKKIVSGNADMQKDDAATQEKNAGRLQDIDNILSILASMLAKMGIVQTVAAGGEQVIAKNQGEDSDLASVSGNLFVDGKPVGGADKVIADLQMTLSQLKEFLQMQSGSGNGVGADAESLVREVSGSVFGIAAYNDSAVFSDSKELDSINAALAEELAALKNILDKSSSGEKNLQELLSAAAGNASELGGGRDIKPMGAEVAGEQKTSDALLQDNGRGRQDLPSSVVSDAIKLQDDIAAIKTSLQKIINEAAQSENVKIGMKSAEQPVVKPQDYLPQTLPVQSPVQEVGAAVTAVVGLATVDDNVQFSDIKHSSVTAEDAVQAVGNLAGQQQSSSVVNVSNQNVHGQSIVSPLSALMNNSGESGGFAQNSGGQGGQPQPQAQAVSGVAGSVAQLSAGETGRANFSQLLNRPENVARQNIPEQIVFHVKTAVGSGNSKISIQLHPEDLGKLDITMDVGANGKASINITTDNKNTLDLLQRDSRGLERALSEAGLKADSGSLSFNLRGGQGDGGNGQNQSQAAGSYRKAQPEEDMTPPPIATVTGKYTLNILPDGLDIRI